VIRTPLTGLLGIRYPIVQSAMGYVSGPALVAAVSNAGGLGMLASATMSLAELNDAIKVTREATDASFGVNIRADATDAGERVAAIIASGVPVCSFAQAPRPELIARLRDAGVITIASVGARRHAEKVAVWGVDAVIATGGEGGGHVGAVPTSLLIPQVAAAVDIPVIAAGGFFDGRGLVAALAYGAAGIAMGTRFLLTSDSPVPESTKRLYLAAGLDGTVVSRRVDGVPHRVLRTPLVDRLEKGGSLITAFRSARNAIAFHGISGMSWPELLREGRQMRRSGRLSWGQVLMAANTPMLLRAAMTSGRTDLGVMASGQVAGLIEDLPSCEELISRIMREAEAAAARLQRYAFTNLQLLDPFQAISGMQHTLSMVISDVRHATREGVLAYVKPRPGPGLVIAATTVLALALRLYLVSRHGFLTSGTIEYDDGVYLGAAVRLTQGVLPYRDFAFVQPPGILLLSLPSALVAHLTSTEAGLAVARLLTVAASVVCVPLAGRLVRYRGSLVTLVTCGFLAVYPADILASRTLLLEPWMNACCLLGANLAFSRGRLAGNRALAWAGVAFGFAVAVKYWAVIPAALLGIMCLPERGASGNGRRLLGAGWFAGRWGRARSYGLGLAAGFAVPVLPFVIGSPGGFVRDTILDQMKRTGTAIALETRLAYLTGLIDIMNRHGMVTLGFVPHSLFSRAGTGTTSAVSGVLPALLAGLGIVVLAAGYLVRPRERPPLEWFALAAAALSMVAIMSYSAFFYHYPDFTGPWLAIACGAAAAALPTGMALRRAAAGVTTIAVAVATILAAHDIGQVRVTTPSVAALIPAGSCVFTDQVSLTLAADRFTAARPGCPQVIDSLATTLSLGDGTSVQAGAARLPGVIAAWESVFEHAQYVWLSQGFANRIPWPDSLQSWFAARFRTIGDLNGSILYKRIS
jgi:NAD(P)H-dependent flavin oxidoreductase YrpB (nitropropane dioxygenase family)